MWPHKTKGKYSVYEYVVRSPTFAKQSPVGMPESVQLILPKGK